MEQEQGNLVSPCAEVPVVEGELVTAIDVRDEEIERVATEVVRRDVREERLASSDRNLSPPRMRASAVDPFACRSGGPGSDGRIRRPPGTCQPSERGTHRHRG